MKQVVVLVEGQTEGRFVSDVLQPYLNPGSAPDGIWTRPVIVETSRTPAGIKHRGGGGVWRHYDKNLRLLLAQPHWHRVGLLLDYYAYPADAPGVDVTAGDARARHGALLSALGLQYQDPRFVPGIALHEFETWVIAAAVGRQHVLGEPAVAHRLQAVAGLFGGDVELIDDGPATAPSKRVAEAWSSYSKIMDGIAAIDEAGLGHIRGHCPTLADWLTRLTT